MMKRFEGPDGKRNLVTALKSCFLVEHNEALAERLAEAGKLESFAVGDVIITQGADDNDVYFILVGQTDVLVNNRHVAIRGPGDSSGEISILNPSAPRSATVIARTDVVALKVTEPDYHQIAEE